MIQIKTFDSDVSKLSLAEIIRCWTLENKGSDIGIDIDPDVFVKELQRLVRSSSDELFVADCDGLIVGLLGIETFNSPIGRQKIANEHFWYVVPEYRGTLGVRLLTHAMTWAKEKGCTHILLNASCLASDLHNRICRLYEQFGMSKFETVYIKEL